MKLIAFTTLVALGGIADAHISVATGPAIANKSQKITLAINHGCDGADTVAIKVDIPAAITAVRPMYSDLGAPAIVMAGANVASITWTKPTTQRDADDAYYEVTFRGRVGDLAFQHLLLVVTQTCKKMDGTVITAVWDQPITAAENTTPNTVIVPSHSAGWNKVTIPAGTTVVAADLPVYFGDALIVWKGTAAYSANPNTATLIAGTTGVTALATDLAPGDEVWVKY